MENELKVGSIIGYNSQLRNSLYSVPGKALLLYSSGNTLILNGLQTKEQHFLKGHGSQVSLFCISKCGKFAASADTAGPGFIAEIIVWDLEALKQLHSLKLHKGAIKALSFSCGGAFLASVGGVEDKNRLIVWDLKVGKAAYCHHFGLHEVRDLVFFNGREDQMAAVTEQSCLVLTLNAKHKKVDELLCNIGNLKRSFSAVVVSPCDSHFYAGTTTGDLIEIQAEQAIMKKIGPSGKLFQNGIRALLWTHTEGPAMPALIIGSGDGYVSQLDVESMKRIGASKLEGAVSGIALGATAKTVLAGTQTGNICEIDFGKASKEDLPFTLRESNHVGRINAVCFPKDFSEVFATCGREQIRVWALKKKQELLRICVPKTECFCVGFSDDGKQILSGWSDGKIRAFFPQSGKLMWVTEDAHANGVTALAAEPSLAYIVTGGMEGDIRIWNMTKSTRTLANSLKEHRGRVWSMQLKPNSELVSCSADGSCIVWDMKTQNRLICIFDKTIFKQAVFHPDCSQLVTVGSDMKLSYWTSFEGDLIRTIRASQQDEGEINAVDVSRHGEYLLIGGEDAMVSVYGYNEGRCLVKGAGHCGTITNVKITPDGSNFVSVGAEGEIIIWDVPAFVQSYK